jgi:hypothetical protein
MPRRNTTRLPVPDEARKLLDAHGVIKALAVARRYTNMATTEAVRVYWHAVVSEIDCLDKDAKAARLTAPRNDG